MSIGQLFWVFFKFGLLCFGGGYMLVPLFSSELVGGYQVLTREEFVNLISIAQMTPGPIGINAATYVGFLQHGPAGAVIATVSLVLPSFFLVIAAAKMLSKWEKNFFVQGFLAGMRPAAAGMIVIAGLLFAEMSIFRSRLPLHDGGSLADFGVRYGALAIFGAALLLQGRFKLKAPVVILGSALLGILLCR